MTIGDHEITRIDRSETGWRIRERGGKLASMNFLTTRTYRGEKHDAGGYDATMKHPRLRSYTLAS